MHDDPVRFVYVAAFCPRFCPRVERNPIDRRYGIIDITHCQDHIQPSIQHQVTAAPSLKRDATATIKPYKKWTLMSCFLPTFYLERGEDMASDFRDNGCLARLGTALVTGMSKKIVADRYP